MESLGFRQVPDPSSALDPSSLAQEPNGVEMDNLHRTISATSDITEDIQKLGQLPVMSSMANKEMAETSTPPSVAVTARTEQPLASTSPLPSSVDESGVSTTIATGETEEKANDIAIASSPLSRLDSTAIGPAVEDTHPLASTTSPTTDVANPVCHITLLLTSGARHGYKVDERYLLKRQTTIPGLTDTGKKDPYSISVYTLKELILREWREEWEVKPSSPSSIRLIYFGRLLNDNTALKECRFNETATNVVHMTVRPQDIVDEEESERKKAEVRQREGEEQTPGCGRCVIL